MRSSLYRSNRPALPTVRPPVAAVLAALSSLVLNPALAQSETAAGSQSAADAAPAQLAQLAQLAPVVVTSTRTAQPLTEALPHTTVVTQEDIVNSQAPDLRTLLRNQAGVEFSTTGGMGSTTSLFMRGANSNQSLVLIDGVRISSSSTGTAQLENILPDEIDHIEVVRGNVSALYGSDAIGGVVQIFTKSGAGKQPDGTAQAEYGSNNTRRATVGYGGQVGDTSFNLTGSIYKTDGFSSINAQQWNRDNPGSAAMGMGPNPNANPYENKSVSAQVKHQFTPGWDAGLAAYYSNSKTSFDNTFGSPTDDNRTDSELYTVSAFVNGKVLPDWTTHFKLAQSEDRSESLLNGVSNGTFNTRNHQFNWQNEYALAPSHTLVFGTDYLQQELDANSFGTAFRPSRNVFSVFGGYDGRFGNHQLQLNARNDHYSDFGNQGSFYAGYGYNVTQAFKVIGSLSNAFRAPTFNELYFPGFGNPNLQPERAKSAEVGVQYNTDAPASQVTGRQHEIVETLAQTARAMSAEARTHASSTIAEIDRLVQAAEQAPKAAVALQADMAAREEQRLAAWTETLGAMAAALRQEWERTTTHTASRQQEICDTLAQTTRDISAQTQAHASHTLAEVARLVEAATEAPKPRPRSLPNCARSSRTAWRATTQCWKSAAACSKRWARCSMRSTMPPPSSVSRSTRWSPPPPTCLTVSVRASTSRSSRRPASLQR